MWRKKANIHETAKKSAIGTVSAGNKNIGYFFQNSSKSALVGNTEKHILNFWFFGYSGALWGGAVNFGWGDSGALIIDFEKLLRKIDKKAF